MSHDLCFCFGCMHSAVDAVDQSFFDALAVGGRLVAPVRIAGAANGEQDLILYTKVAADK
jgi:protein-L-isoaspartate O-methyltransferase